MPVTMDLDCARRLLFSTGTQALREGHRPHGLAGSSTAGLGIQGGRGLFQSLHTHSPALVVLRGTQTAERTDRGMIPRTSCWWSPKEHPSAHTVSEALGVHCRGICRVRLGQDSRRGRPGREGGRPRAGWASWPRRHRPPHRLSGPGNPSRLQRVPHPREHLSTSTFASAFGSCLLYPQKPTYH